MDFQILEPATLWGLANLAIALVLSLLLRWHYMRFGSTFSNRAEFSRIFPLVALAVVVVITVVKTSLALSLGLVGALSIIRFRTPIKEPEELAYLFFAVMIGIGLGAGQVQFTVASTLFILVCIGGFASMRNRGERPQNLYIAASSSGGATFDVREIAQELAREFRTCDLRRVDSSVETTRASFSVEVQSSEQLFAFLERIRSEHPEVELSIVEQLRIPGV